MPPISNKNKEKNPNSISHSPDSFPHARAATEPLASPSRDRTFSPSPPPPPPVKLAGVTGKTSPFLSSFSSHRPPANPAGGLAGSRETPPPLFCLTAGDPAGGSSIRHRQQPRHHPLFLCRPSPSQSRRRIGRTYLNRRLLPPRRRSRRRTTDPPPPTPSPRPPLHFPHTLEPIRRPPAGEPPKPPPATFSPQPPAIPPAKPQAPTGNMFPMTPSTYSLLPRRQPPPTTPKPPPAAPLQPISGEHLRPTATKPPPNRPI